MDKDYDYWVIKTIGVAIGNWQLDPNNKQLA